VAAAGWRGVECISDLHLQPAQRATFEAWRRYMAETPADALFILGDLFEAWIGDDDDAPLPARVASALKAVRDAGVPISVLAPPGGRSPTVTCVALPDTHKGGAVAAAMETRGFIISPGYGKLKDTSVRIGHMGDHTLDELDVLLDTLREVLTA